MSNYPYRFEFGQNKDNETSSLALPPQYLVPICLGRNSILHYSNTIHSFVPLFVLLVFYSSTLIGGSEAMSSTEDQVLPSVQKTQEATFLV